MVLGDLGAEVIKVEHPVRGDDTRDWGMRVGNTETAYFNSVNRNKRSVCLDLKTPEGQQIARDLIRKSDIVIQNFKFGDIERLGLGYEQMKDEQPGLIYCSITGYDRTGPEAARPGYDLVIQGEAGLMALNGEPTQPPLKFGVAAVDMMTGMYAAQGVLAALYEREKTGLGRHVGMALFDCGLMITAYYGLEALLRGNDPPRYGNAHPSIMPYGVYEAEDGPLVIAVGNNSQFVRFCTEVIERPDLASDERFKTNLERTQPPRGAGAADLRAAVALRKRKELLERHDAGRHSLRRSGGAVRGDDIEARGRGRAGDEHAASGGRHGRRDGLALSLQWRAPAGAHGAADAGGGDERGAGGLAGLVGRDACKGLKERGWVVCDGSRRCGRPRRTPIPRINAHNYYCMLHLHSPLRTA